MSYIVLARKYRPARFEDVVGQDHVVTTLSNAIEAGRAGHAYLFIGPRGVGKTTTARILASAFNCESGPTAHPCGECANCVQITDGGSLDVIEMDAASHTGVDNVRELREHARFNPTQSRFKVYIIDEVHMLSTGAFNALLKILEEPPPHVRFILATTEAQKVPATIVSRCQRFEFRRVAEAKIIEHLAGICDSESIQYETEALAAIARVATGSVRDALSLTDQLAASGESSITLSGFHEMLGMVDWDSFYRLGSAVAQHDTAECLRLVDELDRAGKDMAQFAGDLLEYLRHLLVARVATEPSRLIDAPPGEQQRIVELAQGLSPSTVTGWVEGCAELVASIQRRVSPRIALETFLIRACTATVDVSLSRIIEKLAELENRLSDQDTAPTGPFMDNGAARGQEVLPGLEPEPADELIEPRQESNSEQGAPAVDNRLHGVAPEVVDQWRKVLEAVESTENWTLHSFLTHVRPAGIEENGYVVEVAPGEEFFRKNLQQRAYRRTIEEKLAEVFGRKLRFVCRIDDSLEPVNNSRPAGNRASARPVPEAQPRPKPGRAASQRKSPSAESASKSDREQVTADPGVRNLIDMFSGTLAAVNKLEFKGDT